MRKFRVQLYLLILAFLFQLKRSSNSIFFFEFLQISWTVIHTCARLTEQPSTLITMGLTKAGPLKKSFFCGFPYHSKGTFISCKVLISARQVNKRHVYHSKTDIDVQSIIRLSMCLTIKGGHNFTSQDRSAL